MPFNRTYQWMIVVVVYGSWVIPFLYHNSPLRLLYNDCDQYETNPFWILLL